MVAEALVAVGVAVAGREEELAAVLPEAREPVQAKAERALAVARPLVEKAGPAEATRAQEEPAVGPRETMAIITATTP